MDAFSKLKAAFGSQAELARLLGISSMAVSQWRARGRIPAERCAEIAAISGGRLSLSDLRPDLFITPSTPDDARAA